MNETVRGFLPMVDFLEQVLGKNSEIVLHDFSDPDHAIVDIRNGMVSGRTVGGPATDLALKIMNDGKYRDLPFITGYEGRGAGGKTLESSTFFIREGDEIVGMLCVNTDLSAIRKIGALAEQLAPGAPRARCRHAQPERPRGHHPPAQPERRLYAQGRRGQRRQGHGDQRALRLPLPAKGAQGRIAGATLPAELPRHKEGPAARV